MPATSAATSSTVQTKGLTLRGAFEWIQRTQGRSVADQVLNCLPDTDRKAIMEDLPSGWHPVSRLSNLLAGFAQVTGPHSPQLEPQLRAMGAYVAETNLNTIYRVILAFVNPNSMASHLPRLWGHYFQGLNVQVKRLSPNSAHMLVSPLDQLSYISPASAGWIEFAYRHVGARSVTVRESNFTPDQPAPRVLDMHIEWK